MSDKEQLIQVFEHAVNKAWGEGFDYIDLSPRDCKKILELLKAQEEIKTESDFMTHIIGEICDFAVKNNAKPDDALGNLAESILELLDVCSFNNWKQKKEGDLE